MKFPLSAHLIPISIGVAIGFPNVPQTDIKYTENEFTQRKVGLNEDAFKVLNTEHTFLKDVLVKDYFEIQYKKWRDSTWFMSNSQEIIMNNAFQAIISLQEKAIPLILTKIAIEPSCLVWALNIITGIRISNNSQITITDACKLWVKSGKSKGVI